MGLRLIFLGAAIVVLSGCGHVGYYAQAARGQASLLMQRESVDALIASPNTRPELAKQLALAQRLRRFALERLDLQDNQTFSQFADIGRSHVVWNLVAAPELSIAPRTWCFPIAGCVAYKGFFREPLALDAEVASKAVGDDTYVYGVNAYSTLGWFNDPLLNTFIHYNEISLASLIFHELTHQVVYFQDDSAFNEAFATAVEIELVGEWLKQSQNQVALEQFEANRQRHSAITDLVLAYRERLDTLYQSAQSDEEKRSGKQQLFDGLRADYAVIKNHGEGTRFYDWWFGLPLNNAHLLTVSTYYQLVPPLRKMIAAFDGDLPRFFAAVRARGPDVFKEPVYR